MFGEECKLEEVDEVEFGCRGTSLMALNTALRRASNLWALSV
jgi:hypothetical protein